MPKTKEEKSAHNKAYYQKNKERIDAQRKVYYEKNKESIAAKDKEYKESHKEERAAYKKAYNQTANGKKSRRISDWKRHGIISADYNSLYERYLDCKNCEECNIELTEDKRNTSTTRCLDHDHSITDKPNVRNVLCNACNRKRR
tara:strand:- start:38 stop:469 length:432 start_codon:yes stop_codon:yes gene_type:complete